MSGEFKAVYLHWIWGSDQRDEFAMVEVILSLDREMTDEEKEESRPPIHVARTEMDTLAFQLVGLNLSPNYVGPDGSVQKPRPPNGNRPVVEEAVTKKKMSNREAISGLLIIIVAFWLIVGPLLWFFSRK